MPPTPLVPVPVRSGTGHPTRRAVDRRRLVRICARCQAVACVVGVDGTPIAWVAADRPAALELRVASAHPASALRPSHGLCPACFEALS